VVIGDIEAGPPRKAADDLGAVGILTDVSDLDSVRALARSATERFGTVHVVCNNAGRDGWVRDGQPRAVARLRTASATPSSTTSAADPAGTSRAGIR
jgi:NAD(P)-dependent dehydrogenase (short-subunit alcohol dehydrogenase family)